MICNICYENKEVSEFLQDKKRIHYCKLCYPYRNFYLKHPDGIRDRLYFKVNYLSDGMYESPESKGEFYAWYADRYDASRRGDTLIRMLDKRKGWKLNNLLLSTSFYITEDLLKSPSAKCYCYKCKKFLPHRYFDISDSKDGLVSSSLCHHCTRSLADGLFYTPMGKIDQLFHYTEKMLNMDPNIKHLSKDMFIDWCFGNGFTKLFNTYAASDFRRILAPAVIRYGSDGSFTPSNMYLGTYDDYIKRIAVLTRTI